MAHQSSSRYSKLPHAAVASVSSILRHMERVHVRHAFNQVSAQGMRYQRKKCHLIGCRMSGCSTTSLRVVVAARLLFCTAGTCVCSENTWSLDAPDLELPNSLGFPAVQKRCPAAAATICLDLLQPSGLPCLQKYSTLRLVACRSYHLT